MNFPTYKELEDQHCSVTKDNPFYEDFAHRRYNPSPQDENNSCRLVFLKPVLEDPNNKTLRRKGRFIWCKNLQYEGKSTNGFRQFSFTVDAGKKRFKVEENNVLCIPEKAYVHNNRYFRAKEKTFFPFSTVFGYKKTMRMMTKNSKLTKDEINTMIHEDNPYKPGTLVKPRLGYFYPSRLLMTDKERSNTKATHPCGIILGEALMDDYLGREFYRVRFGQTTYEKVHPTQLEIINEV